MWVKICITVSMSNTKLHCFINITFTLIHMQFKYISVLQMWKESNLSASSTSVVYRFSSNFLSFLHFKCIPLIALLFSVIILSCILSCSNFYFYSYDLLRPGLAGAQLYSWSSPGCQFYIRGWRWLPALGLRGSGGCRRSWSVTRSRVGPEGTGPSTGVLWSWLEDR